MGLGDGGQQVAVARLIPGQQGQVIRVLIVGLPRVAGVTGDVCLDADDGLDAASVRFLVELDSAVEDAVVREGDRLLAQFAGAGHEQRDAGESVQEGVFGVKVEVSEHQIGSKQQGTRNMGRGLDP